MAFVRDQTISVTLFFEVIIFSLGLEAVTEAICHTGHLLDKVIYFRAVIGNLSCMAPPSPSPFHSFSFTLFLTGNWGLRPSTYLPSTSKCTY